MGTFWPVRGSGDTGFSNLLSPHPVLEGRIEQLEHELARLALLNESLWQLLQDHLGLSDADILPWVEAVRSGRRPAPRNLYPLAPPALPTEDFYGPPPPPPVVTCTNCNTRFQRFEPQCPSCGCIVPISK